MDIVLHEHFAPNILDCDKDDMDTSVLMKSLMLGSMPSCWILVNTLLFKLEHIDHLNN